MTSASDRMTVVVDETKLVTRLGGNTPLSAEIVSFGWQIFLLDRLMAIGGFQLRWIGHLGDDAARDVIAVSVL
jgi:ribose 5-phosphate isomerase